MVRTLASGKNYQGKYVALKDFDDPEVVTAGKTPLEAQNKARHKGFKNPAIVFIPKKGTVQIY